jgi:hypothetical protein
MVATQQVGENNDIEALDKERLTVVQTCRERWCIICQAAMTHAKLRALLLKRDIEPTTESTVVVRPKKGLTRLPTIPTQVSSNHVRVHAAHNHEHGYHDNSTLYRACTHSP